MHNKSLHWIFATLRSAKTSELGRYTLDLTKQKEDMEYGM